MTVKAWAITAAGIPLEPFEYDPGPLSADNVEIAVETCGICHSDISMIQNEWGLTTYPLVPGHEVSGRVTALGSNAKGLKVGQRVGVGWASGSCMHCQQCLSGEQNLCAASAATIIGRHGGFADKIRAQWPWAIPIPVRLRIGSCSMWPDKRPISRSAVEVRTNGTDCVTSRFYEAWQTTTIL